MFLELFISGVTQGSIYAVVGLGFMIVFSVARLFNLAMGEFVMLGGMFVATFYALGLPLPVAAILAVITTGIIGTAVWRIFLHRLLVRGTSHLTLVLITVGVALLSVGVAYIAWGTDYRELPDFIKTAPIHLGGVTLPTQVLFIWGMLLLMIVGLSLFFDHTWLGKGLRACADQPEAARLIGLNPHSAAFFSFVLAATLGAVAGVVLAPLMLAHYAMGLSLTLKGLLASVVGGVTKAQGVVVGGLVLGLIESFAGGLISSEYMVIIALATFIIILLFRPQGILGGRQLEG